METPMRRPNLPPRHPHGLVLGVLKGLARHFGIAPWILRAVVIALIVVTSFWIVLPAYLVAAILMPVKNDTWSTVI
jgi:phage shock protein PspC (stress-responsive transcriptional regulator)